MSEELKPCPFCGGTVELITGFSPLRAHFVDCKCGASSPVFETSDEAIQHWNRRAQQERKLIDIWHNIQQILKGIDDCSPNDDAYWETSVGAQFGKEKLAEIKALLIDK